MAPRWAERRGRLIVDFDPLQLGRDNSLPITSASLRCRKIEHQLQRSGGLNPRMAAPAQPSSARVTQLQRSQGSRSLVSIGALVFIALLWMLQRSPRA